MPLPVLAETVSSGTPFSCDSPSSSAALTPLNSDEALLGDVPFVERDDQRAAFLEHLVGDPEVLRLEPAGRVEQQHHHLGMSIARRVSAADSFSSLSSTLARLRRPAVSTSRTGRPFHSQSMLI